MPFRKLNRLVYFFSSALQFVIAGQSFSYAFIRGDFETMQHSKRKVQKQKKNKNYFMYIRLCLCVVVVLTAVVLKAVNAPALSEISKKVSEELEVEKAVEVLSGGKSEEGVSEVFEEEREEESEEEKYDFEKFYVGEQKEEVEKLREAAAEKEKQLELEVLSYQMSAEELSDDTAAEPFKIPPPSNCSYSKEKIDFKYCTPLRGTITSRYGYRDHPIIEDASFHTGLDIAAKQGTDIVCFAAGKVIDAGKNATYGNYLLIEHADGYRSFYGHNSKLLVKKGQKVSKGQKIARVGSTGMSTGPHLHFEVRQGIVRLDPAHYISPERV